MRAIERDAARLPVAILISGRGSNMRVIAERAARGDSPIDVRVVVSDQPDAPGLVVARELDIPTEVLIGREYPNRAAYDAALTTLLHRYEPALIVLAGFMRILSGEFVETFAGRILNIHPSLLPRHRGLHTHRRVLEAGEATHGASVHFVTPELDGGPVILQAVVPVRAGDDEAALSARVQAQEHRIYPQVIDWFARGRVTLKDGRVWLDGRPLEQPVLIDARSDEY